MVRLWVVARMGQTVRSLRRSAGIYGLSLSVHGIDACSIRRVMLKVGYGCSRTGEQASSTTKKFQKRNTGKGH